MKIMKSYSKQEVEAYLREHTALKHAAVYNSENDNYINDLLDLDTALRKLQKNNSNLYKALVGVFVFGNPIQEQARLMNVSKRQINRRLDDGLHVLTMIMNGDMYED